MPWAFNAADAADGKQNCNTPPPAMHVTQNHTTQAVHDIAQTYMPINLLTPHIQ
jgi:hypothetical protein